MGVLATIGLFALLQQEPPRPAPRVSEPVVVPQLVLAAADDPVPIAEFGLGDGGMGDGKRAELRWIDGGCVTPGGVRVECRSVGVKLTFPSGRELLVASDGLLHLRSGEFAGPFTSGMEIRLGDGSTVRVSLGQAGRDRLRDVLVAADERVLQPWRRGEAATWVERPSGWAGIRLCCCGDGGAVYRAIALGPLLVLDRLLVAADREKGAPTERLVLMTAPLRQSLATMQRQHREVDAAVRHAVAAVAAVADRGDAIFPAGAGLFRAEKESLRWLLRGGFELEIDREGPMAPRLCLFAGRGPRPMVEWTLGPDATAFMANPRDDQPEKRWHGNGTRLPRFAVDLQARSELRERAYALSVLARLAE